jgi:RNA polymerase sigma-70 factor (ECF subfamily)
LSQSFRQAIVIVGYNFEFWSRISQNESRCGRQRNLLSGDKNAAEKAASETQLIERARRGDEEAFAALFNTHKRRVYSLCLRMTGAPSDAEDLTQEAFLQLFRKIGTFRGESAFTTWLHRLVVNVVLMRLRKKGLQQVSLDEPDTSRDEPVKRDYGDNDKRLMGSVDRIRLTTAIESLPPGYRTVFVLHDVEGYEHNEIAQIMNCSIGNSKSQLHKARLKLRELLRSEYKPQEGSPTVAETGEGR